MKKIVLIPFLVLVSLFLQAQISVCSWNLYDFGKTKTDAGIEFIANSLKEYDVIAIQEVVAKDPGGAAAVARLSAALNNKGSKWDYTISGPTTSSAYKAERYAFIWKTSRLTLSGKAWLENKYNLEIDREPFLATFICGGKQFTLVNFHAITKARQPETEIKYLQFLPAEYPGKNLLFCGDFNCPQSHTVFNPLKKMGYNPILLNQKTSLKETCDGGECLSSAFDNMFYAPSKISFIRSGIIPFYKSFTSLKEARAISDHVPVFFQFALH